MRVLTLAFVAACLAAADPASAILAELQAANRARADQAGEAAAWNRERARLEALIAATAAETARLAREAASAEAAAAQSAERLAALGQAGDLEGVRSRLAAISAQAAERLRQLAASLPPGVITLGEDAGFDAVVRALELAERAAGTVTVEVVSGHRAGQPGQREAVKLLRVAGAAAWWVALDGNSAGRAAMREGALELSVADPDAAAAVRAALAQAEGRAQPMIVVLP